MKYLKIPLALLAFSASSSFACGTPDACYLKMVQLVQKNDREVLALKKELSGVILENRRLSKEVIVLKNDVKKASVSLKNLNNKAKELVDRKVMKDNFRKLKISARYIQAHKSTCPNDTVYIGPNKAEAHGGYCVKLILP